MLPSRRSIVSMLMVLALAACGGPDPTSSGSPLGAATPAATAPASSPAAPSGSEGVQPEPSASEEPIAAEPPPIAIEAVAGGLEAPISIASAPDGWLLVNERAGRVMAVDPASGATEVAMDIRDRVLGQGEQGLLGLALHPDWPDEPRAFVHYTDRDGDTVLSEFAALEVDPFPRLDPASERVLLTVDQPFANHNGGQLAFGPGGFLWMALGDGGSGGDPQGNGQNPDTLLGTILRLDVSEPGQVSAPADNPFVDGGGAAPVALFGLRNPWRFSFDEATGMLWIADVGQNAWEEVNRIDPVAGLGANLGWAIMEAGHCFADAGCSSEGLVLPVAEYDRGSGCSVTGGHVYRGTAIPDLTGWYVFGDYCSGILFGLPSDVEPEADGTVRSPRVLLDTDVQVASFGEGSDGELYVADIGSGTIYRVVAGD